MAFAALTHLSAGPGPNGGTSSAINTTGANLLVVGMTYYDTGTPPTLTDSYSNSWTGRTIYGTSLRLYYCIGGTVGSGHTFTNAGTGTYPGMFVAAFSGAAAAPFDQENGSASVATAPGSITPAEDNELIIAVSRPGGPGTTGFSIDSGMTILDELTHGANNFGGAMAYKIQTTATAIGPTFSYSGGSSGPSTIVSFKAAAAATRKFTRRRR